MILTDPALILKKDQFNEIYKHLHPGIRSHGTRLGIGTGVMAKRHQDRICQSYGLPASLFEAAIMSGGSYHDIGKSFLSSSILERSDRLSDIEKEAFSRHPKYTAELLREYADVLFESEGEKQIALDMALYHHERHDGGGYPGGLKGDGIPFIAQLCALLNTLDQELIVGRRRNPFDPAADKLIKQGGSRFSPEAITCFTQSRDAIKQLYESKNSWLTGI